MAKKCSSLREGKKSRKILDKGRRNLRKVLGRGVLIFLRRKSRKRAGFLEKGFKKN